MKTGKNNLLLLIAGLLFITSVSADSIIHDHISEEETSIECQYNENKTVDINQNKPSFIGKTLLEKIYEDLFEVDYNRSRIIKKLKISSFLSKIFLKSNPYLNILVFKKNSPKN